MTSFISHAQNFEDVMLWRALQHVEGGFYLDVGAWSPDLDSITRAFYERGWAGINIEPNLEWMRQLNEKRPRDINLPVAISNVPGEETFHFFANLGLSTMDTAVAREHMAKGWTAEPGTVTVTTLNAVWEEHVGDRQVHFLKIDVEGLEERVLLGNDWRAHRPWIVVVESTHPMSQIETHAAWEPILTGADYRLAYVDGLNRFYVAVEHTELLQALHYPPNVFDRFMLASEHEARTGREAAEALSAATEARAAEAAAQAESALSAETALRAAAEARATEAEAREAQILARLSETEARLAAAEAQAAVAAQRAGEIATHLQNVYNSKSWRYTRPLRWLKHPSRPLD